jgi:D-alanyl-D-alanine carboxypeptidase
LKKDEVVQCKIEPAKQLQAPIEENTVVGTVTYELNGTMIEQFKIYTVKNVEKSTFWNIVKKWLKILQDFVGNLINK